MLLFLGNFDFGFGTSLFRTFCCGKVKAGILFTINNELYKFGILFFKNNGAQEETITYEDDIVTI